MSSRFLVTTGLTLVVLTAAGCSTSQPGSTGASGPSAKAVIKLAYMGPMTGSGAVYGQDQYQGLQLAADVINKAGGVAGRTLSFTSHDDAGDPNQAASVAQQLCDDTSVVTTFGDTFSSSVLAALPIFTRCGMPDIVSYASNPTMDGKKFPTFWRTIVSDAALGSEMAHIAVEKLGMKKIGVLIAPNDYGSGLRDNFVPTAKELGATIVGAIVTSKDQKDYTPQLTQLKAQNPDGLVLLSEFQDEGLQLKQAMQMGLKVKTLLTTGGNTPDLVSLAGPAAEGVFIPALFNVNSTDAKIQEFVAQYQTKFGKKPGEGSALAYQSLFVFKAATEKGAALRQAIQEGLKALGKVDLPLTGAFKFDALHQPEVVPGASRSFLLTIKGGQFVSAIL